LRKIIFENFRKKQKIRETFKNNFFSKRCKNQVTFRYFKFCLPISPNQEKNSIVESQVVFAKFPGKKFKNFSPQRVSVRHEMFVFSTSKRLLIFPLNEGEIIV
jgi:hypothetical protein